MWHQAAIQNLLVHARTASMTRVNRALLLYLQVLHPSAMQPLQQLDKEVLIRVRNSYNLAAPGSIIVRQRPLDTGDITSIVLKEDVHLLDVVSTRMLGNFGFLAKVFDIFKQEEISVDVVATSEISVSVTLDSGKLWSRDLIGEELDNLAAQFEGVANVTVQSGVSIISLICDASRSSHILKQVRLPVPAPLISHRVCTLQVACACSQSSMA
jgi:aspartate kinase